VASTLSTRIADLRAIADAYGFGCLVVIGFSFGGLVALHAGARDDRVRALVLRAPVPELDGYDERAQRVREEGPAEHPSGHTVDRRLYEDLDGYDTAAAAGRVDVPVAVVHSVADKTVPPSESFRTAARLAGEDILVQQLPGEGHVFCRVGEDLLWETAPRWL
jgi:pimeloyl-ACP methyl ester carboxylesterase